MSQPEQMTAEAAEKIIDAVLGEGRGTPFATQHMKAGDIGLVMRVDGGIEILSVMPPDGKGPDGQDLDAESIGWRGMFAIALYKIAHDRNTMTRLLQIVTKETAQNGAPGAPKPRLDS